MLDRMSDPQPTPPYASDPSHAGSSPAAPPPGAVLNPGPSAAAATGAPAGGYPGQPAPTARGGSGAAGRIGFVIALLTVLLALVGTIGLQTLIYSGATAGADRFALYGMLAAVQSFVLLVGYALSLIFGIIGARAARGKVLAGIAIGVGGAGLVGVASSWLMSLIVPLLAAA